MNLTISILLWIPALVLGLFAAYQFILFVLSLPVLPPRGRAARSANPRTRFVVVVPAHNEELLIAQTVDSIVKSAYPGALVHCAVIADNCTDRTAEIARAHGAHVYERFDEIKRGKPYALDWLIQQLNLDAHDALVIIDADTVIDADFLYAMDNHLTAGQGHRALQGYFGIFNPDRNWLTRLSLLPGTLKYRLHYPAKELLRLSCPLTGNGMCFDIGIIRQFGWRAYSLTENWEYWVQLTLAGIRVGSAPDAVIYSQATESLSAGQSQRMRWMKGRIETLRNYAGRLVAAAFRNGSAAPLDALVELAKPAHAMLFFWSVVYAGAALGVAAWDASFTWAAITALAILASQVIYLFAGFVIDKPPLRTWLALAMVPWYLAWKLLVSVKGLLSMRDRAWVRTKRHQL